jgi:hypothetical protein
MNGIEWWDAAEQVIRARRLDSFALKVLPKDCVVWRSLGAAQFQR